MRIQHNIMAMNAYRNYNTNTSALSKNLEKLSSGYKINRAGDDAAGLAISEKMRAQITGLEAAQKNVKDGVSLVKTAEGAMQEVQDMLNRMEYLATQSANGTYDNEVDRNNLQKEVDALKTEINRIADSANFNGIKLLDGSLAGVKESAAWTETAPGQTIKGIDRILQTTIGENEEAYQVNGKKTVLDKYAATPTKASFTIDLKNLKFKFAKSSTVGSAGATISAASLGNVTITIGTTAITIKGSQLGANVKVQITASGIVKASSITAKALASAALKSIGSTTAKQKVTINGVDWKVTASGSTALKFTQLNYPTKASQCTSNFTVHVSYGSSGTSKVLGTKGTLTMTGDVNDGTENTKDGVMEGGAVGAATVFEVKTSDIKDGAKFTIGSKTLVLKVGPDSTTKAAGNEILVDLSDMKAESVDLNKALTRIGNKINSTNVTTKNAAGTQDITVNFKVGVTMGSTKTGISVMRATAPASAGSAVFTSKEKLAEMFGIVYGDTYINHEAVAADGGLMLQIGDTSDSYNQMRVVIGDMHTTGMGIDGINISNQTGAAAAIQTIKDAINYVSGIRGDLGAVQNRLEHTGNNLSVMAENIQDAESTIRDTDVAEEMMSYVKNNILVQSAQAMLAQANQVPQGVLQLLG